MPAIVFDRVSRKFEIRPHHERSLQERFIHLFRRRSGKESFWALRDVSFSVEEGEVVGVIGENGAGKSTTLKLIARTLLPTSGRVVIRGRVSALLELGAGFHPDLTGRENIYLNGSLLGFSKEFLDERFDDIVRFAELEAFIDQPVKTYSSGMYMRLGFAIAVHVDPDILLTDEVLAVGDEAFQKKCLDRMVDFRRQGKTIFFVSHNLGAVRDLCTRAIWLDHGRVAADGEPLEVIDAYLETAHRREKERLEQEGLRRLEEEAERRSAATPSPDDPFRWGSREVEIRRVEFVNGNGEPTQLFFTGEPFVVRMHYFARERVELPVFGLAIHHISGFHINGPNTRFAGLRIPYVEGEGVVEYRIPHLPLMEGTYLLTAAAYDWSMTHPYDHHEKKYRFRVVTRRIREKYGVFYIPSEWEWTPGEGG